MSIRIVDRRKIAFTARDDLFNRFDDLVNVFALFRCVVPCGHLHLSIHGHLFGHVANTFNRLSIVDCRTDVEIVSVNRVRCVARFVTLSVMVRLKCVKVSRWTIVLLEERVDIRSKLTVEDR